MARIEINTLVVVRRVFMEFDDRPVSRRLPESIRRSGVLVPAGLGAPSAWSVTAKPRHSFRSAAAGALFTLAAVALGDLTRRQSRLPALSLGSAVKALPSPARRSLPELPEGLSRLER